MDDHRPRFVCRLSGCSAVSHAIPRRVFPTLEFNHWYSNVLSRCGFGGAEGIACDFVGGVRIGQCRESFVPVGACVGACPESFVPWVCAAWLVCGGLREKVLPASVVCVSTGIIFSLLASKGPKWAFFAMLGEFCTGCGLTCRVPGEFCTVGVRCVASVWWSARENSPRFECLRRTRDIFRPARRK